MGKITQHRVPDLRSPESKNPCLLGEGFSIPTLVPKISARLSEVRRSA
jgi:hypothetical protein